MKKLSALSIIFMLLIGLCGCNQFQDTPETDAAFAAYEAAVRQTIAQKAGEITVVTKNQDTVVEKTESLGVIEYSFRVDDQNRVSFERNDFTNDEMVASYYGDGKAAYQMDFSTDQWIDVTNVSGDMLDHEKNIFSTLSLFRIDHNFRYSKRFYKSVAMEEAEGEKIITVVIKNSELDQMFSMTDEKGIRREMASQTRKYYIDDQGIISKIMIDTAQKITYKGNSGILTNLITVTLDYEE